MPRAALLTTTWAFPTAAPVGSVTVPVIEPVSCARSIVGASETDKIRIRKMTEDFILHPTLERRGFRSLPLSNYPGHPHGGRAQPSRLPRRKLLLKRMNSVLSAFPLSSGKCGRSVNFSELQQRMCRLPNHQLGSHFAV